MVRRLPQAALCCSPRPVGFCDFSNGTGTCSIIRRFELMRGARRRNSEPFPSRMRNRRNR